MDGTGQLFAPFAAALNGAVETRIVSYPPSVADYNTLTAFASKALPTDGEYILLGESFSGPIATMLAASRPPGLVGLILCATFVGPPRPALSHLRPLLDLLPALPPPIKVLSWLLCNEAARSQEELLRAAVASIPPTTLQRRLSEVLKVDARDALNAVAVPILYLRAKHDRVVPPSASERIRQTRPDVTIVDISAPHFLLQTAPQTAAEAVSRFAADLATARKA